MGISGLYLHERKLVLLQDRSKIIFTHVLRKMVEAIGPTTMLMFVHWHSETNSI